MIAVGMKKRTPQSHDTIRTRSRVSINGEQADEDLVIALPPPPLTQNGSHCQKNTPDGQCGPTRVVDGT